MTYSFSPGEDNIFRPPPGHHGAGQTTEAPATEKMGGALGGPGAGPSHESSAERFPPLSPAKSTTASLMQALRAAWNNTQAPAAASPATRAFLEGHCKAAEMKKNELKRKFLPT
jgi:hypothetical protein